MLTLIKDRRNFRESRKFRRKWSFTSGFRKFICTLPEFTGSRKSEVSFHFELLTLAKKKWRIFRANFERVNISDLVFFCLSHESVSNLLFNSERFIQIDECSEEQQSYYKHRGHWWIAQFLSTMHFPKNNNHLWEALINKRNQIKPCGFHHYIEHAKL